jgi:nucleoside-diphosphate-sugar epimerase
LIGDADREDRECATRFSAAGGSVIVLRLGLFYGPGARHSEFLAMARHHVVPLIGSPESYLSSIQMIDAGTAVAAALQEGWIATAERT